MTRWRPVVERDTYADPVVKTVVDERDVPLPFVQTPRDKDIAALAKCHLEANRRRLNRLDTAQSLAETLARQQAARDRERLTEAQKQTALLRVIARGVHRYGTPKATTDAIRLARRQAKVTAG